MKRLIVLTAFALLALSPARADENADLAAIKAEIGAMNAKIHSLEVRLAKAEGDARQARAEASRVKAPVAVASNAASQTAQTFDQAQTAAPAAPTPQAPAEAVTSEAAAPPPPSSPPASNNAFNPGIAAVLNGFYVASSRDTQKQRILGVAAGDESGLPLRGFSLGESEVSLAANIDPELSGFLDFSMKDDNSLSVEEAYILTKDLPYGLTVKAGRFLSGIGYLNERHAHDWSFSDASLPYRAFLNSQYGDDGIQVRWLAPTDQFLEFGAEAFRGDAYPAANAQHGGQGTFTAFVHTGNDIDESSSYLAALSYLHSRAENRATGNGDLFTGNDDLGIASLVYKWAPEGNPTVRNLTLASELFYGREQGLYDGQAFGQNRFGWYAQGVYQFMPQWSVGLRYAGIDTQNPGPLLSGSPLDDLGHGPRAETALLEYDTSEFGRLRLQYTHDESDLKPNDEILLQYTVIYGPHGAHRY
ncbi:MAG: hypothetical protein JO261_06260 [Alphaproteobacteria bacterium]|nr:hypothetical protein [Alphaproteobacteria bacterium]MBV9693287.1 hypothetical protein [Alphaproteobacteria bacterium]